MWPLLVTKRPPPQRQQLSSHLTLQVGFAPEKPSSSLPPEPASLCPSREFGFASSQLAHQPPYHLDVLSGRPQASRCVDVPGTRQGVSDLLWTRVIWTEWGSPDRWEFCTLGVTSLRAVLGCVLVEIVMLTLRYNPDFPSSWRDFSGEIGKVMSSTWSPCW